MDSTRDPRRDDARTRPAAEETGSSAARLGRPPRGRRPRLANTRRRAQALFVGTLFIFSVFAAQLVRVQGLEANAIAQKGRDMRVGDTTLPAPRGQFTDHSGVVLAGSVDRYSVVSCPKDVRDYKERDADGRLVPNGGSGPEGVAAKLSPVLGMSTSDLLPKLTGGPTDCYKVVKKGLEPMQWRAVADLKLPGISQDRDDPTPVRDYPGGSATAPLIGWVGADGKAQNGNGGGLELLFNDSLTGKNGRMSAEYAVTGQVIPMGERETTPAVPGSDIKLTIDNDLQWYAYNAIAGLSQANKADWGEVVVMDKQGRIRAAAQYPAFDPKNIGAGGTMSSLPFQAIFEPGSTAKVMSIGAALDQGVTTPTEQFTVPTTLARPQNDIVIHDMHDRPTRYLTTTGILAVSSNIGTSMIAEKMSPETLYDYQRKFGMGATTSVDFPGESAGIIVTPDKMSGSQRYTVMYGQGIDVTAVQAVGLFQAVANGGVRISPTLVEGTTGPDGKYTPTQLPQGTQVLKPETAKTLLHMMENVTTEGGTAVAADISGYRIAGKTGTADVAENGRYTGKNVLSFVGVAPADSDSDSGLICGVFMQTPNNDSSLVAPVFKSVMTYGLQKYRIPPTGSSLVPFPNYWGAQADRNTAR